MSTTPGASKAPFREKLAVMSVKFTAIKTTFLQKAYERLVWPLLIGTHELAHATPGSYGRTIIAQVNFFTFNANFGKIPRTGRAVRKLDVPSFDAIT
ncbi:hypothetical protein PY365_05620 [Roseiarcaceae bacterium H3SJ34-1]|uniref:hypothetical protein n=1 Tax=Terripilifer ovatus TaxID=3032367 RepID=UPI003AB95C4E|nr:hypothetical protein [Roseiarcaceae bacterium H3SJ34-1]